MKITVSRREKKPVNILREKAKGIAEYNQKDNGEEGKKFWTHVIVKKKDQKRICIQKGAICL